MKENQKYLTLLNVAACFSVMALHTNGAFWHFTADRSWLWANFLESFFFFAVPLFFMLSGIHLLDFSKRYDIKTFLKKRFTKTFVPFFFWNFLSFLYFWYTQNFSLNLIHPKVLIEGFLQSTYHPFYWFFFPLFSFYLLLPLFSFVQEEKKDTVFAYLALLAFVANVLFPFMALGQPLSFLSSLPFAPLNYVAFYALMGYLLHRHRPVFSVRISLYLLGILGFLLHCLGTQMLSFQAGEIVHTFKGYDKLPAILQALAIFVFFQAGENTWVAKVYEKAKVILPCTFGMYLIHGFLLKKMQQLPFANVYSLSFKLGGAVLLFFLSFFVVKILRKFSFFQKVLP